MDREYLKRVTSYFLVSVLAIGAMIYICYHLVKNFTSEVETQPAKLDTFSEAVSLDAYILRNERVLRSDSEGTLNYLVSDGEKVAAGDEVADICRGGGNGIRERISEIDEQIDSLEKVIRGAAYSSTSDAANIETGIRGMLYDLNRSVKSGNLGAAASSVLNMKSEMNKYALVTGKIEGFDEAISSLKAERARLSSQLTDVVSCVYSDVSAYFFYDVDGYEDAFACEDIDALTVSDVFNMSGAEKADTDGSVGKLVLDYMWYAVFPTDRETALYFDEGKEYDVTFSSGGGAVQMTLRRVMTESGGEGRAALVFESGVMPDGFEYRRMQTATVTVRSYTGYRVPLSAIRVLNVDGVEVEGVYILYGSIVYFRRIEVILSQDGYALCNPHAGEPEEDDGYVEFPAEGETEPVTTAPESYSKIPYLSIYEMVITSARGLYEGKIVED